MYMYSIQSAVSFCSAHFYYAEAQTTVSAEKQTHDDNSSVEVVQNMTNLRIGKLNKSYTF